MYQREVLLLLKFLIDVLPVYVIECEWIGIYLDILGEKMCVRTLLILSIYIHWLVFNLCVSILTILTKLEQTKDAKGFHCAL